jgi:glutathione S-transferase
MTSEQIVIGNWRIRGLGAPIVYLCEYLAVRYRMDHYELGGPPDYSKADFRNAKDGLDMPFANLPYVIDGEIRVAQSLACSRYICRQWGPELLGKGPRDLALVDTMSQVLHDDRLQVQGVLGYGSPERQPIVDEGLRRLAVFMDHMADQPYLAGDYVTYIDFICWEIIDFVNTVGEGRILDLHPALAAYFARVSSLPRFREYLASERFLKYPYLSMPPAYATAR